MAGFLQIKHLSKMGLIVFFVPGIRGNGNMVKLEGRISAEDINSTLAFTACKFFSRATSGQEAPWQAELTVTAYGVEVVRAGLVPIRRFPWIGWHDQ